MRSGAEERKFERSFLGARLDLRAGFSQHITLYVLIGASLRRAPHLHVDLRVDSAFCHDILGKCKALWGKPWSFSLVAS